MDASAATRGAAREQAQNHRISRVIDATRTLTVKLGNITGDVGNLAGVVATQQQSLSSLQTLAGKLDTRVSAIEALGPQIFDALTKLKDGLTAAGAGLNSLKTLTTSTEYGVGQVYFGATPQGGSFVVTPNVPDDVQQAQTTQSFNAGASTGVIHVLVAVRSNESDGDGSVPAAHCRVTVVDDLGHTTTSKPTLPAAGIGTAPFYPILTKSAVTSTIPANAGFPFGQKASGADADHVVDLTDTGGSGNAVAPDGTPATASPAKSYSVSVSCVDLSPSTSDPSA
jgi:hypothetical protein